MAYKYAGTQFDAPTLTVVKADPAPGRAKRPADCSDVRGTPAGYKRHKRAGEDACDPCKAGIAKYSQDFRAKVRNGHKPQNRFVADRCGTPRGYWSHYRYKVTACEPCRTAYLSYMADYRAARKAKA